MKRKGEPTGWGNPNQTDRDLGVVDQRLFLLDMWDTEPEPSTAFVRQLEDALMSHANAVRPAMLRSATIDLRHPDQLAASPPTGALPSRGIRAFASHSLSWL